MKKLKILLVITSVVLFCVAQFLPVFETDIGVFETKKELLFGYEVLLQGWMAFSGLHFGWLANITWFIAIILFLCNKNKAGLYFGCATALLTIDGYFFPSGYFAGFYVWNAAMLISPFLYLTKEK